MWPATNNSGAPTFALNTNLNANWIEFQVPENSTCGAGSWIACTQYDSLGRLKKVIYDAEYTWCEDQDVAGCRRVSRVALHELGHVAGLARKHGDTDRHYTGDALNSVMVNPTPGRGTTGWAHTSLRTCDVIQLQREYDVASLSGDYPDCGDDIPNVGVDGYGIKTSTTQGSPSDATPCINLNVTISGTSALATDATNLGLISGNALQSRVLTIERKPVGGSWTDWSTASVNAAGSWTKTFTSTITAVWYYRATFDGETSSVPPAGPSLYTSTSATVMLTWISSPCPQ
jgi:hypothetical protein